MGQVTYLKVRGTPRALHDLGAHALIGFDQETLFLRAARKSWPVWPRDSFALRSYNGLAQLAMMRAGAGIGVCQGALARREPRLVRLLAKHVVFGLETWITMHEDLRGRVTFDALVQGPQRHVR